MHFENYLRIPEEFVITEWEGGMKEQQKYGTKAFIPSGGDVCWAVCVQAVPSPTGCPKVEENWQVWATELVVGTKRERFWRRA